MVNKTCQNRRYTITKCLLEDKEDWPSGLAQETPTPHEGQTQQFRLLDDDKNIYFEGFMIPTDTEMIFYPLDTIGLSYGCTEIQILNPKGEWETV